jgi:hypothetical protein
LSEFDLPIDKEDVRLLVQGALLCILAATMIIAFAAVLGLAVLVFRTVGGL